MSYNSNNTKNVAMGALIGVAAGFVAGILLAPKSGKETRADIKRGAGNAAKAVKRQLTWLHEELSVYVAKANIQFKKLSAATREEAMAALAKSKRARDQVEAVLTAIQNGDSDDEDLDLAVKNAQNALDSLKKYLKEN